MVDYAGIVKNELRDSFVGFFLDFVDDPDKLMKSAEKLKWKNADTISYSDDLFTVSNNGDITVNKNKYNLTEFSDQWKEKPNFLFEYLRHTMELAQWIELARKGISGNAQREGNS